jgi:predicted unusual protein kinase regulating ubiquinone biosynthesis (AarF/ABC1/UbiB family)
MSRAARIWCLALGLLAGLWWDGQRWTYPGGWSDERARQRQRRRARWLTNQFLGLGSAFIKLGQLL